MARIIRDWRGLHEFGIQYLSGDACPLDLRMLCDLNEDGRDIVRDLLGLPAITLHASRAAGTTINGKPKVGSVMLPIALFSSLATLALHRDGALRTVITLEGVVGTYIPGEDAIGDMYDEYFGDDPDS